MNMKILKLTCVVSSIILLAGIASAGTIVVNGDVKASNDGIPGQNEWVGKAQSNDGNAPYYAGNPDRATNNTDGTGYGSTSSLIEFN